MPKKLGRDLRPGDLLVTRDGNQPYRLTELRWTTGGLFYIGGGAAQLPLNPMGDYEVAHPMPDASLLWSTADQAWVVTIDTAEIPPDGEHRVLVNLDGRFLNEEP